MNHKEIWTTLKILTWTREFLGEKGIINARLEAEWMLCAATGLDRVGLYLNYDKPLNEVELASFREMVSRRARREPLQHILGTQEFCGADFTVSPAVLIPRHDTETLVHEAVSRMPQAESILDIGTGSGCIAITLAKLMPNARVTAVDISEPALQVAKENAARHQVHIDFRLGSLFDPVAEQTFDLIVSNPPYIPSDEIKMLEPEVSSGDPLTALDGGIDGLEFYRRIIPAAIHHLTPHGWLLLEVGAGQSTEIRNIFINNSAYDTPVTAVDNCGVERVVGAMRKD